MDARPPCDASSPGRRPSSFPASCSLGSLSLSDGSGEFSSGTNFPSSGSIPILLFDADDASDLLGSDPASLSSRREPTNDPTTWQAGCGPIGPHVAPGSSSAVLGAADSSAAHGPSNAEEPPTRGESERNHSSGSHRLVRLAFSSLDSESASGSADGHSADSLPSHPHRCRRHSSSSRSSSLGSASRDSLLRSLGSQTMRRTCCGSREPSPAAITTTQLIAPAKKHEQYFALETLDPQIGQPFSNSISLDDCVEQARLPLTSNHDARDHRPDTSTTPSPACSSTEPDLAVESPPRRRAMDRDLPPPYSPTIEPPSSSPPSNFHIPHHLLWLQSTTVSLCIDQEGFRAVFPTFKLVGFPNPTLPIHTSAAQMQRFLVGDVGGASTKQLSDFMDQASMDSDLAVNLDVGMAEFMPLKRERFVFHHSTLDIPPSIRRLSVNGDESKDYLSKHAYLGVKSSGAPQVYAVCGSEVRRWSGGEDTAGQSETGIGSSPIKLEWRFEYMVEDKRKADGTRAGDGEKFLTPLRFSCSPALLHPKQGRKVTVLSVWRKNIQPGLVAGKVDAPLVSSPAASGHQTHKLAGSSSPPTSPKGSNGALRFPAVTKLWGKWTKTSPYRFDKGSDGSEEELIPSGDSANGTRRPRPASIFISRVSQEAGRPMRGRDGDSRKRGQSTDGIRLASRDARPATASGERSRRMCKTQSLRRETRSEGEDDRVFVRYQDGHLASRSVYRRRPRTAR